MYNLQQDIFVTNLVYEEKENYTLTSKQDELLPSDFTTKQKENLHKWCYKLGFEDGVTGFIEYIDEFYLPSEVQTEFYAHKLISVRLKQYKDEVYMNQECGHTFPFSVEQLIRNLKSSWGKIVLFFTEPFNLYFFQSYLFHETISYRVSIKLKEGSYSSKVLKKYYNSLDDIILRNSLNKQESDLLKKLQTLYKKEFLEVESMTEDYFDNNLLKKIYISFYKDTSNKNEKFECFSCTEDDFIDTFNLKTDQKKIKIKQNKLFFYLIIKLEEKLALKLDKESIEEYRIELFKRIDDKRDLHKIYNYEAYRLRSEVLKKTASKLGENFAEKVDKILS